MSWSRVIAPSAGVCILAFSSVASAQTRESINPLARPLRDIGITRQRVPEPLQTAVNDPYVMPVRADGGLDCSAINTEITALNIELGSDIDMRIERREGVGDWVAGAMRGAIDLPYRSVVRRLSGAERRERDLSNATEAGMVRRAFLRGIRESNCTRELPPMQADALAPNPTIISIVVLNAPNEAFENAERYAAEATPPRPVSAIVAHATPVALASDQD